MPPNVNMAENASTLNCGLLGSLAAAEVNRTKYLLKLGPIDGLTVKSISAVVATLTPSWMCWTSVCELTLPTQIPTDARPKSVNEGALPSSIQVILQDCPAWQVVVATGEVIETVANARGRRVKANAKRILDIIFCFMELCGFE